MKHTIDPVVESTVPSRRLGARSLGAGTCALLSLAAFTLLRAPWPDDWDGVGFVLSLREFDLARHRPHFPGYPAYVGLATALRPFAGSDALAASMASAVGGALIVLGVALLLGARVRPVWIAVTLAGSPLVALASTSVGSDALGAGLFALALAFGTRARKGWGAALAAGASAGAALAARPSNAPALVLAALACAIGLRGKTGNLSLKRAMLLAAAGCAGVLATAFAVLFTKHSPAEIFALGAAHLRGHFEEWGGSALTEPGAMARMVVLARVFSTQGLGAIGRNALGVVRALGIIALAVAGLRTLAPRERWLVTLPTLGFAGYVLVAQNVTEARHVLLPMCVVAALAALGLSSLARRGARGAALALGVSLALLAWPTAGVLCAHRVDPPAGLSAAWWARTHAREGDAVLFGGRAVRFGEIVGVEALPCTWMGEVDATLERARRIPRAVFVTDEVRFRERARGRLERAARFCRDARLERGGGCLTLYRYDPLAARR